MEVTKSKWFLLNINANELDAFVDACEELDNNYRIIGSDKSCSILDVEVEVRFPEEIFYLGQYFQSNK